MTSEHRVAVDGWSVAVRGFEATAEPVAVAVLGHGMMCDQRVLDRPRGGGLASTLAAEGVATYTFDVRGHGRSRPNPAEGGRYSYEDVVEGDVPALARWAAARHPGLPVVVGGHSLVGHAAMLAAGSLPGLPVAGVVGFAPTLWLRPLEASPGRWLVKRAALEVFLGVTRVRGYFPTRRLGMGTDDAAKAYVEDLVRYGRRGAVRRRADGFDYFANLARVRVPVGVWVGTADRICAPADARGFAASIPEHRVLEVPGADHMSLVSDPRFEGAWREVAAWIRGVAARGAPVATGVGR